MKVDTDIAELLLQQGCKWTALGMPRRTMVGTLLASAVMHAKYQGRDKEDFLANAARLFDSIRVETGTVQ